MTAFSVRPAQASELASVFKLLQEFAAFQGATDRLVTTPAQWCADAEQFHCHIAVDPNGSTLGFATAFPAYYSWSGKAFYLDDLYVLPDYRGQGIGKALLFSVVEKARSLGCTKVRWQVSGWNDPAVAFYKSLGAAVDATEWNCDLRL